jgi:hypothetical protein
MNFFQTNEKFSLSSSKFTGKITSIDSVLPCSRIHFVQKLLFAWGKGGASRIFYGGANRTFWGCLAPPSTPGLLTVFARISPFSSYLRLFGSAAKIAPLADKIISMNSPTPPSY